MLNIETLEQKVKIVQDINKKIFDTVLITNQKYGKDIVKALVLNGMPFKTTHHGLGVYTITTKG